MSTKTSSPPPRKGHFIFILASFSLLLFIISALATTRFLRQVTEVEVPEIAGKSVEAARSLLRMKRLSLEIAEFRFDQRLPANLIMAQDPAAGQNVKSGRRVRVVVSRGSQSVKMPDVANLSLREAHVELGKRGLSAGKIARCFTPAAPKDAVVAQWPAAGQFTTGSSRVELLVSAGQRPARWLMPDVRGLPQEQALAIFRQIGIEIANIQHRAESRQTAGTILEQTPAPGECLESGRSLSLVANQPSQGRPANGRYITIRYHVPPSASEVRVKMSIADQDGSRIVHNAMERPNANLTVRITVYGPDASLTISINGQVAEERKL